MAVLHPITSVPEPADVDRVTRATPVATVSDSPREWLTFENDRVEVALSGWLASDRTPLNPEEIARAWHGDAADWLSDCQGDFALVVRDRGRQATWLARSPVSSRPLFFRHADASGPIAASLAAEVATMPARLNIRSLVQWYGGLVGSSVGSMFNGVERVEPGCIVTVDPQGVRQARFWDAGDVAVDRSASDQELAHGLRTALEQAVADRLPAAGPVASLLSAGRDSGCVSALAALLLREQGQGLHVFTASPGSDPMFASTPDLFDEAPGAAAVAARFDNITHHIVTPRCVRFCEEAEAFYRVHSAPLGNPVSLHWWIGAQRAAADLGCDTLFGGGMGNLTISDGGPIYLADLIAGGKWKQWWRAARDVASFEGSSWLNILNISFGGYVASPAYRVAQRLRGRVLATHIAPFLRGEFRRSIMAEHARQDQRPPRRSRERGVELLAAMDVGDVAPDRMFGVTMTDPTADRRVIEAAMRIPPERLVSRYDRRPIFELAFGDLLPAATLRAPRRAYQSMDWNLAYDVADLREGLSRYRRHARVKDMLDVGAIELALDRWPIDRLATLEETAEFGEGLLRAFALAAFIHVHFPD